MALCLEVRYNKKCIVSLMEQKHHITPNALKKFVIQQQVNVVKQEIIMQDEEGVAKCVVYLILSFCL